jgi:hypothetical protein
VVPLLCTRQERTSGSSRDLFFIFLVFLAFKLDGQSVYSWKVVFTIPWMWFAMVFFLAIMACRLPATHTENPLDLHMRESVAKLNAFCHPSTVRSLW